MGYVEEKISSQESNLEFQVAFPRLVKTMPEAYREQDNEVVVDELAECKDT